MQFRFHKQRSSRSRGRSRPDHPVRPCARGVRPPGLLLRALLPNCPHCVQFVKMGDPLFSVRNAFFLGAYNTVINEASDLEHLSDADAVERDCLVYRSYIAQGSYEVRGGPAAGH